MNDDRQSIPPVNWSHARLGSIADVSWGDTSTTKSSYVSSGFPAYSAKGADGLLPYADYHRTGVVLSAIGSDCGRTWLAKGAWSCIKNTIRFWSTDPDVHTEFLFWATRDPALWPKRGSAQPFVSQGDARTLQISYPPVNEQRAVAKILGILDRKIEANRRMSESLETMLRAVFRSWFVDFDPVIAKMTGSKPYFAREIWDLFPSSIDSDGTPAGWLAQPLDKVAKFLNGLALQKYPATNVENSLPVIKIGELRNGITPKSTRASRRVPDEYVVKDGDFLFSWSGTLLARFWIGGEGALNQHLFKVTSARYPMWFCSEWIHQHMGTFREIAASKVTTMGHIQRKHLSQATTICPPTKVLSILDRILDPLVQRSIRSEQESLMLGSIRDLLRPKLTSGEIRIRDCDTILSSVL